MRGPRRGVTQEMASQKYQAVLDERERQKRSLELLEKVKQNGLALQHADMSLKRDAEIVTAAVRQDGLALKHACNELSLQGTACIQGNA